MSNFIPRGSLYQADPSFTPLFRLLDEFDTYSREAQGTGEGRSRQRNGRPGTASYVPKFDGRETADAYELHGEFPGLERDKIDIEFTDDQTLVIRGRTEHSYSSGTPSAGAVEGGNQPSATITEQGEQQAAAAPAAPAAQASNTDNNNNQGDRNGREVNQANNNRAPRPVRYWIQERTVGEFARTFHFPGPVDLNAVSARLNDGVLSVVVPKAKKREARRIAIN